MRRKPIRLWTTSHPKTQSELTETFSAFQDRLRLLASVRLTPSWRREPTTTKWLKSQNGPMRHLRKPAAFLLQLKETLTLKDWTVDTCEWRTTICGTRVNGYPRNFSVSRHRRTLSAKSLLTYKGWRTKSRMMSSTEAWTPSWHPDRSLTRGTSKGG
jgi:hypothetical protein